MTTSCSDCTAPVTCCDSMDKHITCHNGCYELVTKHGLCTKCLDDVAHNSIGQAEHPMRGHICEGCGGGVPVNELLLTTTSAWHESCYVTKVLNLHRYGVGPRA